jgi:hypothetical protein
VAPLQERQFLDYSLGLNTYVSNDVVKENQLVVIKNSRFSTLGRLTTRRGDDFYSVPAGETLDTVQTTITGAADQTVGLVNWKAAQLIPGTSGDLTRIDLNLKTGTGTGPVIIEVWSNAAGAPGAKLAQSSVYASAISAGYGYIVARFVDAPALVSGTTYWIVAYIQDDGTGLFNWSSTTAATTSLSSVTSGVSWGATSYALNFKTYLSTDGGVKGLFRAYKSDGTKVSLLAYGTTLSTVNDNTGALTNIKTGLSGSATDYYFQVVNDIVYYANGFDAPRKWDFTTEAATGGSPGVARNLILHKNQMFYVDATDPAKLYWSDIGSFESFTSTNFLYVPSPKSADPITGLVVFNDNLYIFTKRTKWQLQGADSTSFVLRKATGLKGAPNQECIRATRSAIYFPSDDGIYSFNGGVDTLISGDTTNNFMQIADVTKCCAAIANNRYYLFYPPSGAPKSTEAFVYNINYKSWESIDTSAYIARTSVWAGAADSGQLIVASNIVGAAYYAEAATNLFDIMGKKIDFEIRTKYEHFNHPESKKRIKRWYPRFAAETGSYNVGLQYDKDFADTPSSFPTAVGLQGVGITFGGGHTFADGSVFGISSLINPRLNIPGTQRYTQFRVSRSGVNNQVEFEGHTVLFEVRRAK